MGSMVMLWNLAITCESYIFSSATLSRSHGTMSVALIGKISTTAKNWVDLELVPGHSYGRLGFLPVSSNVSLEQQGLILFCNGERDGSKHNSKAGRGRSLGMEQGGEPLLKLLADDLQHSPRLLKQLFLLRKLDLSAGSSTTRMSKACAPDTALWLWLGHEGTNSSWCPQPASPGASTHAFCPWSQELHLSSGLGLQSWPELWNRYTYLQSCLWSWASILGNLSLVLSLGWMLGPYCSIISSLVSGLISCVGSPGWTLDLVHYLALSGTVSGLCSMPCSNPLGICPGEWGHFQCCGHLWFLACYPLWSCSALAALLQVKQNWRAVGFILSSFHEYKVKKKLGCPFI